MAARERLMKTFDSSQLTRSIHRAATRTFFPVEAVQCVALERCGFIQHDGTPFVPCVSLLFAVGAQPIEHDSPVNLGEMMVGGFGGIDWLGGELGLETEPDAPGRLRVFFKAKVFLEYPDQVRGQATFGQHGFPCIQSDFKRRALIAASSFHNSN